ncbi:gastric triacylglycerol lipase-like [Penaeus japonicus]|uniref:gastric triacylglycerol lipase-like n=1 Tax=Penaeus japonicus TaxID=27405 RepID=UPI001C70B269|nr:gastric triacylglycerol lipase-like [Penaeus japonicus]XP_042888750.1 gastric triacylglycerol lipase-like [Penaeus japonicus]
MKLAGLQATQWLLLLLATAAQGKSPHPLVNKSTPEMITYNGYSVEVHPVTTEDGYILSLHRIPHGIKDPKTSRQPRPPVLLQHCLLCSSAEFVMNDPDKALAYMLADAGYDVWMGNVRGNTYSKNHVSLSPRKKEFWQFSWGQMAYYDLPATIDYVLKVTQVEELYYVGFSMGTTIFWAMMSDRPEYNHKVRFMVGMGPVAYVSHAKGPLARVASKVRTIETVMKFFGRYEFLSFGFLMDQILSFGCDHRVFTSAMCRNLLFQITGSNKKQLNKEFLPVMLTHTPAGTSVFTVTHYLQEIQSGNFQKYDYGEEMNLQRYNSRSPPMYDLSKVTVPVALFSSNNDWLAAPEDVERLALELPNVVYHKIVEDPMFTHLDFVWAKDADELVYKDVLRILAAH